MRRFKISIAMTLYNGEKYLVEQLDSLRVQTLQPDELIACDDGSIDNTEKIFKDYIEKYNLESKWHYEKNAENKGAMENFIYCASKCTGDIVFFCDQDDIWNKKKIEEMIKIFCIYKDALVVSCSESYMDSKGNFLKRTGILHRGRDKRCGIEKIKFPVQVRTMHSPGLTLAFKRSFLDETVSLTINDGLTYDISMGLVAAALGGMYRLYKPYVYRRIHDNNTSKPQLSLKDRINNYDHHIAGRKLQLMHMQVIFERYKDYLSEKDKRNLKKRIDSTSRTIFYLEKRNLAGLVLQCFSVNPMDNIKLNVANVLIVAKARRAR